MTRDRESGSLQRMADRDYTLSMLMARRAKSAEDNAGLRTLLVHRLTDTLKAIGRVGLGTGKLSLLCEPCKQWVGLKGESFPQEWTCPHCKARYVMEFVVYEQLDDEDTHHHIGP